MKTYAVDVCNIPHIDTIIIGIYNVLIIKTKDKKSFWLKKAAYLLCMARLHDRTIAGIWISDQTILMLSTLGKFFSRRHIEKVFLFFPENRIWHFMQIKCQILFSRKNKKNTVHVSSAQLAQRVVPAQWLSGRASALWPGGCGFDPWPGHTKDFKNGTSCSFTWRSALRK